MHPDPAVTAGEARSGSADHLAYRSDQLQKGDKSMTKRMMLLALSIVSAVVFALPAIASATPAHISATENFTVSKGAAVGNFVWETTAGERTECLNGVTGSGNWHSTTTGTLTLEFNECRAVTPFGNLNCTTHSAEGGTPVANQIRTTVLEFHLIMIEPNRPGILLTPNTDTGVFAHYTCGGGLIQKTLVGNGIIGTITSPECGVVSTTATLKFEQGASTGIQKHTTWTGVNYHLEKPAGTKAALIGEARLHFAAAKSFICT